jgi:hypothetical protein
MSIQWFPGHMNAARRKAAESMEKVDLVIEVMDARLPQAAGGHRAPQRQVRPGNRRQRIQGHRRGAPEARRVSEDPNAGV